MGRGNTDLMNRCVVCGKDFADIIRFDHLQENEEYLKYVIFTSCEIHRNDSFSSLREFYEASALRKAKILSWMEANEDWTERCCHYGAMLRGGRTKSAITLVAVGDANQLVFQESPYGMISLKDGTISGEREDDEAPRRGDVLLYVGSTNIRTTNMSLNEVENELHRRCSLHGFVYLAFMGSSVVDSIFKEPACAISLGLVPVLRHMVGNDYVGINDEVK